jgi:hypothetical protein
LPPKNIAVARATPMGIASPLVKITERKINVPINSTKYFPKFIIIKREI